MSLKKIKGRTAIFVVLALSLFGTFLSSGVVSAVLIPPPFEFVVAWDAANKPKVGFRDSSGGYYRYNLSTGQRIFLDQFSDVDSFFGHSCGVTPASGGVSPIMPGSTGETKCWTASGGVPTDMGLYDAGAEVAVGEDFVAVLTANQRVMVRELGGSGSAWVDAFPTPAYGNFEHISASSKRVCAAEEGGTIYCKIIATGHVDTIAASPRVLNIAVNERSVAYQDHAGYSRWDFNLGGGVTLVSSRSDVIAEMAASGDATCFLTWASKVICEGSISGTWTSSLFGGYSALTVTTDRNGKDHFVIGEGFRIRPFFF